MAKHNFLFVSLDERRKAVGARCANCGLIAPYVNGKVPDYVLEKECRPEDVNQAAAQTVRAATEKLGN